MNRGIGTSLDSGEDDAKEGKDESNSGKVIVSISGETNSKDDWY
jgi:hypothetical protein